MIKDILLVGAGSFVGGAMRYAVSLMMRSCGGFPWATFTVNILGCLLIGALWGFTTRCTSITPHLNLFLGVELCGGFTTFSTFSKENLALLQQGNYSVFLLYAAGSVVMGLLAVALGLTLAK